MIMHNAIYIVKKCVTIRNPDDLTSIRKIKKNNFNFRFQMIWNAENFFVRIFVIEMLKFWRCKKL